jgi:hypothetical protein
MIAPNEQRQIGSSTVAAVVLMKITYLLELVGDRKTSRIIGITQSLVWSESALSLRVMGHGNEPT